MTRLQRLFGNGYTSCPRWNGRSMALRPAVRASVPAIVAAVLLFASPLVDAGPATSNVPAGVASYNTGRVSVILPQELPEVQLFQDANNSVSASLQIENVFELSPGSLPHPSIVAAAFPSAVRGFNGTSVSPTSEWPITLTASLEVRRQNVSLWTPPALQGAVGGPVGAASLSVSFSPLDNGSTGAGVGIAWTIAHWPWTSPGDLLAVEMNLSVSPVENLTICSGVRPVGLALLPCQGDPIPGTTIEWGSSYDGLEGAGSGGPVAAVSWNSSGASPGSAYTVGARSTGNGSADLVLGAPASGASSVSGDVGFALVAPLAPVAALLTADAPAYAATLLVASLASLGGIVAYRRREARLKDEL